MTSRPRSTTPYLTGFTTGLALVGMVAAAHAGPVYRCLQNGSVAFTQNASDPSCEPIEVNAYEPDPETVSRQKESLKKWRDDRSKTLSEGRRKKSGKKNQLAEPADDDAVRGALEPINGNRRIPDELDFKESSHDQ